MKLVNELPKNAKNAPNSQKNAASFIVKMKPTEGNNYYKFRLLSFLSGTNTRDYPFIEKFVHEKWENDADGKGVYKGFVTCPCTKYTRSTYPSKINPYEFCPICNYTNKSFMAYKDSNYKDKISGKVVRDHKRKYVACIPVFVVNDPHEPTNINKPRVWVIKDKEVYEKLNLLIKQQQLVTKVFNGGADAVDLMIKVKKEDVVINEGKENEFTYSPITIDTFGFGKKQHAIEAINEQLIDGFPFDDEFYTFSTLEELQNYYKENVLSSNNVIDDDMDLNSSSITVPHTGKTEIKPEVKETIVSRPVVEEFDETPVKEVSISEEIGGLDESIETVIEPPKVKKATLTDSAPKTNTSIDDSEIDDLIGEIMK